MRKLLKKAGYRERKCEHIEGHWSGIVRCKECKVDLTDDLKSLFADQVRKIEEIAAKLKVEDLCCRRALEALLKQIRVKK